MTWLEYFNLFMQCGPFIILIGLGFFVGSTVERAHFKRLRMKEKRLFTIPLNDLKTQPPGTIGGGAVLVSGSVVVASDYFKTIAASLRKLIGGEIRSFERLMERGRREAICRMMQQAHHMNAIAVINLRIETSSIGRMSRNPSPMIEVIAYGTAVLPAQQSS